MRVNERQEAAIAITIIFATIVPVVIGIGMLLAAGWASLFGVQDVHRVIFGWITNYSKNGTHHGGNSRVPAYWAVVGTMYLFYQMCEGVNWLVQSFKKQLVPARR